MARARAGTRGGVAAKKLGPNLQSFTRACRHTHTFAPAPARQQVQGKMQLQLGQQAAFVADSRRAARVVRVGLLAQRERSCAACAAQPLCSGEPDVLSAHAWLLARGEPPLPTPSCRSSVWLLRRWDAPRARRRAPLPVGCRHARAWSSTTGAARSPARVSGGPARAARDSLSLGASTATRLGSAQQGQRAAPASEAMDGTLQGRHRCGTLARCSLVWCCGGHHRQEGCRRACSSQASPPHGVRCTWRHLAQLLPRRPPRRRPSRATCSTPPTTPRWPTRTTARRAGTSSTPRARRWAAWPRWPPPTSGACAPPYAGSWGVCSGGRLRRR